MAAAGLRLTRAFDCRIYFQGGKKSSVETRRTTNDLDTLPVSSGIVYDGGRSHILNCSSLLQTTILNAPNASNASLISVAMCLIVFTNLKFANHRPPQYPTLQPSCLSPVDGHWVCTSIGFAQAALESRHYNCISSDRARGPFSKS